jgi:hypothetical protein
MGTQVLVGHPLMPFLNDPPSPDPVLDKARMRFAGDSNTYSYVADTIAQNVRQHLRANLVPYIKRLAYKAARPWWPVPGTVCSLLALLAVLVIRLSCLNPTPLLQESTRRALR